MRQKLEIERQSAASRWTFNKLREEHRAQNGNLRGLFIDENRFKNHLKETYGEKEPRQITALDFDQLKIRLMKRGLSPATIRHILELFHRLFYFAAKGELCQVPTYLGELPQVNNQKTEDLTPRQLAKLWEILDRDSNRTAANIMKFALLTGMRRGEMFKLQWSNIDFSRGFITIRAPKNGQDQKIPLSAAARKVLEDQPRTSEHVFPGKGGGQRVDINKQANRIKRLAGLPDEFRPLHGLRHVFASMLASSGKVDMYALQKLLTHKSPVMTQRYAHMRDEALKKAAELAGDLIAADTKLGRLIAVDALGTDQHT